jgi:hypothetical protein
MLQRRLPQGAFEITEVCAAGLPKRGHTFPWGERSGTMEKARLIAPAKGGALMLRWIAVAAVLVVSAAHAEPSKKQIEHLDFVITIANKMLNPKEQYLSREGNTLVVNFLPASDPKTLNEMRQRYRANPDSYRIALHDATVDNVCKGDFRRFVDEGFDLVYRWYDEQGPIIDSRVRPGECR